MKKLILSSVVAASLCGFMASCSSDDNTPEVPTGPDKPYSVTEIETTDKFTPTEDEENANRMVNVFSYQFALRGLLGPDADMTENSAISPLSVNMALGLLANSTSSDLEQNVCKTLGVKDLATFNSLNKKLMCFLANTSTGAAVELANSVWYANVLTPSADYVEKMQSSYYSDINPADLSTKVGLEVIDWWVSDKTHELIPSISEYINPSEELQSVLVNALYFAGEWNSKFDPAETTDAKFHAPGGDVDCRMMHQSGTPYAKYTATDRFELVDLHFKGTTMMTLVLPREGVELKDLEEALQSINQPDLPTGQETVRLTLGLPKFKIENVTNIDAILKGMGMNLSNTSLDKMGIDGRISNQLAQKALISIDEEGAKLGAATFTVLTSDGSQPEEPRKVEMIFDRPFLFFVHNYSTKSIVMAGKVVRP